MKPEDINYDDRDYQWGICALNPAGWWYLVNSSHPHRLWTDDPRRNRVHQATLWRTRHEARKALRIANSAAVAYHSRMANGHNESAAKFSRAWLRNKNRT